MPILERGSVVMERPPAYGVPRRVPTWKSVAMRTMLAGSCAIILVFAVAFASERGHAPGAALRAGLAKKPSEAELRAELGRGTWNLLHRMAGQFPKEPTEADKAEYSAFFASFARLYPCKLCSKHFTAMLARDPPRLESRDALARWLCERHNEVNRRLKKPEFPCDAKGLEERYGDCGCAEGSREAGPESGEEGSGSKQPSTAAAATDGVGGS